MREDGYCDLCGAELVEAWLTLLGEWLCPECAKAVLVRGPMATSVKVERDNAR